MNDVVSSFSSSILQENILPSVNVDLKVHHPNYSSILHDDYNQLDISW